MKTVVSILTCLLCVSTAVAQVDLEWRPETVTVRTGETVELGLYAVSEVDQPILAVEVIFEWSESLEFVGALDNPLEEYQWMLSDFPVGQPGFDGLNDTWDDGDAYWVGLAQFGDPFIATSEGTLVTTFAFTASGDGGVSILPDVGGYSQTAVWDAEQAANNIVGELGAVDVTIGWSPASASAPSSPGASNDPPSELTEDRR